MSLLLVLVPLAPAALQVLHSWGHPLPVGWCEWALQAHDPRLPGALSAADTEPGLTGVQLHEWKHWWVTLGPSHSYCEGHWV